MKGFHKNSPALCIVLSCHQRWIRCYHRTCRIFQAFIGRIPFEAMNYWLDTQACYTYKAWNTLMSVELQTLLGWQSDPALMLCTTSGWERRGAPRFVPTCYWLHNLPTSHYLRANSLHTQFCTCPWTLSCMQKLRSESRPLSTYKSKAKLKVHSLWVEIAFEARSWTPWSMASVL